jgi:eukaryotic-like serine/threonine-protein kinase
MKLDNPDFPKAPDIGQRYEISRSLRGEPWGEVWLARDRLLGVEVGLKVLPREAPEWTAAQRYYELEAALAFQLRHPEILGVFHLDRAENCLFLVQEPFTGESLLAQFARKQRFSLPQALHLLEQLSLALDFAHRRGGIHRALNPANILVAGDDIRLANFAFPGENGSQVITLELKAYDAPEVIYGDAPTIASNLFSLGVLGFRLVAGSLPYPLTFDEPFPYRLEALPADLGEIPIPLQNLLLHCLAVDPEERFADVAAFLAQLRQVREVKRGGRQPEYQAREPEQAHSWKTAATWAGALLGNFWRVSQPLAQKVKETALQAGGALLSSPRRLLWGLGLTALAVALITLGVRLNRPSLEPTKPFPAAEVKLPAVAGSGPPLTETVEPAPAREQPGTRPAPGSPAALAPTKTPAASPAPAATPEAAKAKEERFILVAATFADQKQAQALVQKLKKGNFKAKIVSRTTNGKTQYQVQLGPVTGTKAAEDLARRLKSQEKITPRIMNMTAKTKTTKPTTNTSAPRTAR